MNFKTTASGLYQASLGILVEIAYSFTIIIMSFGVIYVVKVMQWFLSRH